MHWKHASLLLVAIALVLPACQRNASGPSVTDYQKQRAEILEKERRKSGAAESGGSEAAPEEVIAPGSTGGSYVYDPIGKRDPFRSFILDRVKESDDDAKGPLEQFDLSQLSVTGVVWEADRRRALVLDPSGQNYIVQEGDPIGKNDGRVIAIGDSTVLVREAYVDFHGEKTTKEIEMRVRQSQGG